MTVYLFFPENRIWYFMQMVSIGDNLHKLSKLVFWENKKNIKMSSADFLASVLNVKQLRSESVCSCKLQFAECLFPKYFCVLVFCRIITSACTNYVYDHKTNCSLLKEEETKRFSAPFFQCRQLLWITVCFHAHQATSKMEHFYKRSIFFAFRVDNISEGKKKQILQELPPLKVSIPRK